MEDALFSLDLLTPTQPKDKTPADYKDLALVYLVTQKGGFAGNLWLLHIEDAKKFCSDDCSKGRGNFGGEWCFMWTALSHFFNDDEAAQQNKTTQGKLMPFVFIRDTGKQDKDFERLGIVKPSIKEVSETLEQAGYFISFTPDPH